MKVQINTIGKKIHVHTLVKENTCTPLCHKIRQECGFTQKGRLLLHIIVFSTQCCVNIAREVRLMLPNIYQEIYDTYTCLNFSKTYHNVFFILDILKSQCKFITLWGSIRTCSKKRLAGRSFFQNPRVQGV